MLQYIITILIKATLIDNKVQARLEVRHEFDQEESQNLYLSKSTRIFKKDNIFS